MADPAELVDTIASNWEMPPDFLFDEANLPGPNPEEWPLVLLTALAELSDLTVPDDNAPNETLRLQKFHSARDSIYELCAQRAEAVGNPEAGVMISTDVRAVIDKIEKDKAEAVEAQRLEALRKQAPPVRYSDTADSFLFSKELSGGEELQQAREMSTATGTVDFSHKPTRNIIQSTVSMPPTQSTTHTINLTTSGSFPFLENLLRQQGIIPSSLPTHTPTFDPLLRPAPRSFLPLQRQMHEESIAPWLRPPLNTLLHLSQPYHRVRPPHQFQQHPLKHPQSQIQLQQLPILRGIGPSASARCAICRLSLRRRS